MSISHFMEIQQRKRNPWQHISIILRGKLADANSTMMPPLLESLLKGLKMHIL